MPKKNLVFAIFNMFRFHELFTQVSLDVVDIDPEVVAIATEWFGFCPDDRLKVHVADGLAFVRKEAEKGKTDRCVSGKNIFSVIV